MCLLLAEVNLLGMEGTNEEPSTWQNQLGKDKAVATKAKYVSDYDQDMENEADSDSLGEMRRLSKIGRYSKLY